MLKRLIEVALPLKEVSEQSAREKSIRHGHISTLHIWWARRPLAACRAVVFASLIPDPDDPECPKDFRKLLMDLLAHERFRPNGETNGKKSEDTPRNRCLEFIKHLVKWENSNNPEFIEPARKLIAAAHKFLHPGAEGNAPKVLDPFAGGGAIPLEALRLGCEAHAIDLNPVAHLIELCTLVYPQKYGQPDSRPVPEYIQRLIRHNRAKKKAKAGSSLFGVDAGTQPVSVDADEIIPDVEITEDDYRKNPLAADVKYWGRWVLNKARQRIGRFYREEEDGGVPVAYLWARTVACPNPSCRATFPLLRQLWLCKKKGRNIALKPYTDASLKRMAFSVVENASITFDPDYGTMRDGKALCPFCETVMDGNTLRQESKSGRMGEQLTAVVSVKKSVTGKRYRPANDDDAALFAQAAQLASTVRSAVPNEPLPHDRPSPNSRGLSAVVRYGLDTFGRLFNSRQQLALTTFASVGKEAANHVESNHDAEYAEAVCAFLALSVSRLADFTSSLCIFNNVGGRGVKNTFARQALPMVWDYAESAPFNEQGANWQACIDAVFGKYEKVTKLSGEEVTVGQFLDEVRGLVTSYALAKILRTTQTGIIDPESRFYVVWKWSYIDAKVPADESFKLAQALGMDTEIMWDRSGVLEKSGENVQAVPVSKRIKIKDLGDPSADTSPASLIDVLHRMCAFRDKGDSDGMAEFLARSGQGRNPTLWLVAQAVSEILPEGDKEKQLMQGLLNQRAKLEQQNGLLF